MNSKFLFIVVIFMSLSLHASEHDENRNPNRGAASRKRSSEESFGQGSPELRRQRTPQFGLQSVGVLEEPNFAEQSAEDSAILIGIFHAMNDPMHTTSSSSFSQQTTPLTASSSSATQASHSDFSHESGYTTPVHPHNQQAVLGLLHQHHTHYPTTPPVTNGHVSDLIIQHNNLLPHMYSPHADIVNYAVVTP